jgi:alanyl-tRNA synthetase
MMSEGVLNHVMERWRQADSAIAELAKLLKCPASEVPSTLVELVQAVVELQRQVAEMESRLQDHEWRLPSGDPDDYPQNDR